MGSYELLTASKPRTHTIMNPESAASVTCRGGKRKQLPPVEYLRECFEYRPEDEVGLYWRRDRPRSHFKSDWSHRAWLVRFAGQPAGGRTITKDGAKNYVHVGLALNRTSGNRLFAATHIIMALLGKEVPYGYEVHHRDYNPWNNSEANLEVVHPTRNMQLQEPRPRKSKKSGLPLGVHFARTCYGSAIRRDGKLYFIGHFRTAEEASKAREDTLAKLERGEIPEPNKRAKRSPLIAQNRVVRPVKPLPAKEFLREALDFDAATGVFTWKVRPQSHFPSTRGMNISNASYAGKKAGVVVDRTDEDGNPKQYVLVGVSNIRYYAHRLVFAWRGIEIPEGMQVDHINGIGTDNRPENLRLATNQRNNFNSGKRRKGARSDLPRGIQGMLNGTFLATLKLNGVHHDCGTHASIQEAVAAREQKAAELGIGDWMRS